MEKVPCYPMIEDTKLWMASSTLPELLLLLRTRPMLEAVILPSWWVSLLVICLLWCDGCKPSFATFCALEPRLEHLCHCSAQALVRYILLMQQCRPPVLLGTWVGRKAWPLPCGPHHIYQESCYSYGDTVCSWLNWSTAILLPEISARESRS